MIPEESRPMYELQYPSPEVGAAPGLTLIVALDGFADAGHAVEIAADHLLSVSEHHTLASFNVDELIDYRSRRPSITIIDGEIAAGEELHIEMYVLRDERDRSFLLVSGPEPDMRWEGFTKALADLIQRFNVTQTICLYAVPMTAPHTRPTVVSGHANSKDLLNSTLNFEQHIRIPGAAALHLERELNKRCLNVAGYTAHVPQYLAQALYPEAALRFLQVIQSTSQLQFPLQALENDSMQVAKMLETKLAGLSDVSNDLVALEDSYDKLMAAYHEQHPDAVMPGEYDVPSGEIIGQEFEKFLAEYSQKALGAQGELKINGLSLDTDGSPSDKQEDDDRPDTPEPPTAQ